INHDRPIVGLVQLDGARWVICHSSPCPPDSAKGATNSRCVKQHRRCTQLAYARVVTHLRGVIHGGESKDHRCFAPPGVAKNRETGRFQVDSATSSASFSSGII